MYWESHELDFIHQIKTVEIDLHKVDIIKMELVKYLLKKAAALDKITIYYSPLEFPQPSDIGIELDHEYSTRLVLLPVGTFRLDTASLVQV